MRSEATNLGEPERLIVGTVETLSTNRLIIGPDSSKLMVFSIDTIFSSEIWHCVFAAVFASENGRSNFLSSGISLASKITCSIVIPSKRRFSSKIFVGVQNWSSAKNHHVDIRNLTVSCASARAINQCNMMSLSKKVGKGVAKFWKN